MRHNYLQKKLSSAYLQHRGFTLVEMMLFMGLMGIMLIVLTDILVSTLQVRTESGATAIVAQDAQYLLSRFTYDIRRAESVTTPAAAGQTATELSFVVSGVATTFSVVNESLVATTGSQQVTLNSESTTVSDFSVLRVGNGTAADTYTLTLRLQSKAQTNGEPAEVQVVTTTIGAR